MTIRAELRCDAPGCGKVAAISSGSLTVGQETSAAEIYGCEGWTTDGRTAWHCPGCEAAQYYAASGFVLLVDHASLEVRLGLTGSVVDKGGDAS